MIGLVWGALQALFGIAAAVAAIPAIVEFIEFLVAKIGQGGFWDAIWAMLKAQWSAFSGLFTTVQDLDARARGEVLGGALITVILLVIEILTGLAETGVALEFTAAGLLRVLKATGKMSLDAVKEHAANLSENMASMRRLGRGAMHGLPHAVEGTAEFLRGKGLPPEWKAAVGKVGSHVTGEIGSRVVGLVKGDVQRFRNLRDLSAGVHGHWKGTSSKSNLTEIETEAGITQSTTANITGSPATQLPDGTAENIRQLAGKLKVKNFQYTEDIDAAEAYARRLGVSNVDYGGDSQVANVSNLGLQRLQNRNALRVKRGLEPLPIPDSIRVDSITSGVAREAPAQFVVPTAGKNSIGLTLNSNHVYWYRPEEYAISQFRSSWWSTSDPNHAIFHEIGHLAQYQQIGNEIMSTASGLPQDVAYQLAGNYFTQLHEAGVDTFRGDGRRSSLAVSEAQSVSGYSAHSALELGAEVFANRVSRDLSGSTYLTDTNLAIDRRAIRPSISTFLNSIGVSPFDLF